ncbi:Uma2 family endonuclease, partial [Phormidium sp. CCY1219]|uniref:Uma2 family endonuclease n=1 Tax=Phormidium sp. CCY1219 TaxID=2886104 RepID=UPI002D1EFFBC
NLRLERNSTGEVIIMTPTGGGTSNRNAGLTAQLWMWNKETKRGKALDSSGGFNLPNGAIRSPDASWISREKWD